MQMVIVRMLQERRPRPVPQWLKSALNCPRFQWACCEDKGKPVTNKVTQMFVSEAVRIVRSVSTQTERNSISQHGASQFDEVGIPGKSRSDYKEADMFQEWKLIADQLNKMFSIVFTITLIIIALLCFAIFPHVKWDETLFSPNKGNILWRCISAVLNAMYNRDQSCKAQFRGWNCESEI